MCLDLSPAAIARQTGEMAGSTSNDLEITSLLQFCSKIGAQLVAGPAND